MSNKVKVCLDAGHVGSKYNQSPVVKTYYESAMVWSLHLKLKAAWRRWRRRASWTLRRPGPGGSAGT